MRWTAVTLFLLAYLTIVLLPIWRRRKAALARESPGRVAPPIGADELRQRLHDIPRVQPEIDVDTDGELVRVAWNLDEEARHAHLYEQSPDPTYRLELQIQDRNAVNVRYAVGTINWEPTGGEGSTLEPSVEWRWPLEKVSGPEALSTHWEPATGGGVPKRNLRHLVTLVRHCVLDAGYAWQPVIDIVPGTGASTPLRARESG
jgi:hypothetical protein